jgi:prolipoprotein diacylglyceryltransferase
LYTAGTVPIAFVAFEFDPLLRLGDVIAVRWQTVSLAAVILLCLGAAGLAARRAGLRPDDLLYIVIGAVPGAVVGGRLGDILIRPEAYAAGPSALIDPIVGSLELGLAVVGGISTAAYVASLLGAPVGRWAALLAVPVLLAIGGGKLAMAIGGSGQGLPLDATWATAYMGPGPWGSLAADLPSHPAQVYEGFATLALALVLLAVQARGVSAAMDGRLMLTAIAGWAAIRAGVTLTWRDPAAVGPLPVAGALAILIAAITLGLLVIASVLQAREAARLAAAADPSWPDPAARPRF